MQTVSDHTTKQQKVKIQQWKDRFAVLHENVAKEKEKWLSKYSNLENQLATTKYHVYAAKVRCRTLLQKQINETDHTTQQFR